ncbi:MAG: RraA family protein [Betaproteobacteria bacterium]|nr:RraA family protein [Betaproteobacteria bacterium]
MASDLRERLLTLPTSTIYETQNQLGDMDPIIKPVVRGHRLAGRAFTVKCFIGDYTAVVRAVDAANPGEVLVIDGGGSLHGTIMGGTTSRAAKKRGLAGMVTNAATRDVDEIAELGFPVFAAGVSVRGVQTTHPGWLQIPIAVGGVPVHPGDWIVGDSDGVVVVPAEGAEELFERAFKRKAEAERERDDRIARGESLSSIKGLPPELMGVAGNKR